MTVKIQTIKVNLEECACCRATHTLKKVIDTYLCDEMDVKTVKVEFSRPLCCDCRRDVMDIVRKRFGPDKPMPTHKDIHKALTDLRTYGKLSLSSTGITGPTGPTGATGTMPSPTGMWGRKGPAHPPKKLGVAGRAYR